MPGYKNLLNWRLFCIAVFGFALVACDIFAPLTLEIVATNPGSGQVQAAGVGELWLEFSRDVDHAKAELAFSLRENGALLNGTFRWVGKRLYFQPVRPVMDGKKYEMVMGMGVEDGQGVSLEREYRLVFSTRAEGARPTIDLSWQDGRAFVNGMVIGDRMGIIRCQFSKPVNRMSFVDAFSLSPSLRVAFDWSDGDQVCQIRPLEAMQWQTDYHLLIRDSLTDLGGNNLLSACDKYFRVGTEAVSPAVSAVFNLIGNTAGGLSLTERSQIQAGLDYDGGWESDWGWEIRFSEPVQRANLESLIVFEPSISFTIAAEGEFIDRVQIKASQRLPWNTLFSLQIRPGLADAQGNNSAKSYLYRFKSDGAASQPPSIVAMNLRLNPGATPARYARIAADHSLDYQTIDLSAFAPGNLNATRSYVDLYFSLAPGAELDGLSVASRFSVSTTNGCASLLPMGFQGGASLDPAPEPVANATVLRVYLDVTNQIASGLLLFRLRSGYLDSRGLACPLDGVWPVMK